MLRCQVDLHVGIAVVILAMAVRRLGIDRLTLHALAGLDVLKQLRLLSFCVNLPAVSAV